MAITKTNFINYTRCRRYCALENIRKDKLDSKMTIEEYMKENEKEEYREGFFFVCSKEDPFLCFWEKHKMLLEHDNG